jgi:iron complex transport system substrate-binding protein
MLKKIVLFLIVLLSLISMPAAAADKQTVTDQLGFKVEVPVRAERIVVLMHHALDVMLQLGAEQQIVGVLAAWTTQIPDVVKAMPRVKTIPTPGDLASVNMESLLALKPDLVILTHYAPKEMREQIKSAGIPVVTVAMFKAEYEEAAKLNPTLKDPEKSYADGLQEGVRLIGQVTGRQKKAEELIEYTFRNRALVTARLGDIPPNKRATCYMAYPQLNTMGTGKYAHVAMHRAGGRNVAEQINGYRAVSMEQVLKWDPEVIFIQDRYEPLVKEIYKGESWQPIRAVKNKRVYLCPPYVKPWGHSVPESVALGELWMAKKLYPEKFKDIDMQKLADDYYRKFYGIPYDSYH